MNSGLPSLLDAIFGKQDLDSVSLEEMYELINEFPSFNAGHFLLSKKLKQQNEMAYEKETMRTALYFNNPFWLQSVLNEEIDEEMKKADRGYRRENEDSLSVTGRFETTAPADQSEPPDENRVLITEEFFGSEKSVEIQLSDEPKAQDERIFEELKESVTVSSESGSAEPLPEADLLSGKVSFSGDREDPVKSFDDLISKYKIQLPEQVNDLLHVPEKDSEIKPDVESPLSKQLHGEQVAENEEFQFISAKVTEEGSENLIPEEYTDSNEIREEIINEYGIFEEVIVKKQDFDLEAFDKPARQPEEPEVMVPAAEPAAERNDEAQNAEAEIPEPKSEHIDEISSPEQSVEGKTEADYEAFDRPIDKKTTEELPDESAYNREIIAEEESITEIYSGQENRMDSLAESDEPDDTGNSDFSSTEEFNSGTVLSPGLAERINEHKKTIPPFDPQKAESIVFAPYHMIDYFASQGIKLVMEENPADPFGKQLKSFTDWLKVMKKLPAQSISESQTKKKWTGYVILLPTLLMKGKFLRSPWPKYSPSRVCMKMPSLFTRN